MKRIEFISNGKGVLKDRVEFREKRVKKAVEDALDYADEQIFELEHQAIDIVDSIETVADSKEQINKKINDYLDKMEAADGFRDTKKYLEKLKEILEQEVEVDETVQEVRLVK
jgi:hypothetical protein